MYRPGDVVHELFCIPTGASVTSERVFLDGVDITGTVSVTASSLISGSGTTHAIYKISYTIPTAAADRKVYHLVVDWKDDGNVLQCPHIFEAQVSRGNLAVIKG